MSVLFLIVTMDLGELVQEFLLSTNNYFDMLNLEGRFPAEGSAYISLHIYL